MRVLNYLKNHPFAVQTHFERSLVLTFAVPKTQLRPMVPQPLSLDSFQDEWAFIAVAMVQTRALRPKGFPKFIGDDFFLIGYRVFVRYQTRLGKRLRGLYILKSETDRKKMMILGNLFTHYNYTKTDVEISEGGTFYGIRSDHSKFEVTVNYNPKEVSLPLESPFSSWKEARRYAGPLPFSFTCDPVDRTVLIIEGVRSHWKPEPVQVKAHRFDFLDQLNLKGCVFASAFEVTNVPYYWKKGRLESWN